MTTLTKAQHASLISTREELNKQYKEALKAVSDLYLQLATNPTLMMVANTTTRQYSVAKERLLSLGDELRVLDAIINNAEVV